MKEARCVLVFFVCLSGLLLLAASASAQPSTIAGDIALDHCMANCFGLADQARVEPCMIRCDNAAATRPRDEPVTLSSEEYLERWGDRVILPASACHSTTPCPAEYDSCASWSGYTSCGDTFCGIYRFCCANGPVGGPAPSLPNCDDLFGDALKGYKERYRVCFNAGGQSCTEWERTTVFLGCGCF